MAYVTRQFGKIIERFPTLTGCVCLMRRKITHTNVETEKKII